MLTTAVFLAPLYHPADTQLTLRRRTPWRLMQPCQCRKHLFRFLPVRLIPFLECHSIMALLLLLLIDLLIVYVLVNSFIRTCS